MYLWHVSWGPNSRGVNRTPNSQNPSPSNQYSSHSGLKSFTKAVSSCFDSSLTCLVTDTKFLAWYITEATAHSKSSPSETRMTAFTSESPSFRAYIISSCTKLCCRHLHELELSRPAHFGRLVRHDLYRQQQETRDFFLEGSKSNREPHPYREKSATFHVEEQAMVTTTEQVRTICT